MNLCYQHQLDSTPTKLLSFSFIRVEIKKKLFFNHRTQARKSAFCITIKVTVTNMKSPKEQANTKTGLKFF